MTADEQRRVDALCAYRCPDHGCDLEEYPEPDGDETGVWVTTRYRCPSGGHDFAGRANLWGSYYPVEG